jgi:hypothetical protein
MIYKSKCKEVSCCCLKIVRDTEGEEKLDEAEAQQRGMGIVRTETKDNVKCKYKCLYQ